MLPSLDFTVLRRNNVNFGAGLFERLLWFEQLGLLESVVHQRRDLLASQFVCHCVHLLYVVRGSRRFGASDVPARSSARGLVRTGVEARSLEMLAHLGEGGARLVAQREAAAGQGAIDVEHAEPDGFHVERADRDRERGTFLKKRVPFGRGRLGRHPRAELLQACFRGFPMIGIRRHACATLLLRTSGSSIRMSVATDEARVNLRPWYGESWTGTSTSNNPSGRSSAST